MNSHLKVSLSRGRFLPLTGARNVRDLGGYLAVDGRTVKWGRLFRSGDLDQLTEADLDLLNELEVKTIVDFRRLQEAQAAPDRTPKSADRVIALPMDPGDFKLAEVIDHKPGSWIMEEVNRSLATDYREDFRRFLALLAEEDSAPVLFHCAAGKDRTGFAAMLILAALGVGERTIMADYLLSNEGLGDRYDDLVERNPLLGPLVKVEPSYLSAGLEIINSRYGGLSAYLTDELGADLDKLRDIYLD